MAFQKGQHPSPKTEFRKGIIPWNKGLKGCITGKKNPKWQGGVRQSGKGWIYLLQPNHPFAIKSGYVLRSRLVIEKKIGRYLSPKEVVHHINGNRSDDSPKNLMLFSSQAEHLRYHFALKKLSKKTCQ